MDDLSSLTPEQVDLLREMVRVRDAGNTANFIFVKHNGGRFLVYPGGISITTLCDTTDLILLEREGFVALSWMDQRVSGKPTQKSVRALEEKSSTQETGPSRNSAVSSAVKTPLFQRKGDFWMLAYEEETTITKNMKGMGYIAQLLQNPNRLHLAADLVGSEIEHGKSIPIVSGGKLVDRRAMNEYRSRAKQLESELEDARRHNDLGRKEKLEEQLELLTNEIVGASGMSGRSRKSRDDRENFRKSVSMAINRAIQGIHKTHPRLANHLDRSIDRGHFLIYTGEIDWQF